MTHPQAELASVSGGFPGLKNGQMVFIRDQKRIYLLCMPWKENENIFGANWLMRLWKASRSEVWNVVNNFLTSLHRRGLRT